MYINIYLYIYIIYIHNHVNTCTYACSILVLLFVLFPKQALAWWGSYLLKNDMPQTHPPSKLPVIPPSDPSQWSHGFPTVKVTSDPAQWSRPVIAWVSHPRSYQCDPGQVTQGHLSLAPCSYRCLWLFLLAAKFLFGVDADIMFFVVVGLLFCFYIDIYMCISSYTRTYIYMSYIIYT